MINKIIVIIELAKEFIPSIKFIEFINAVRQNAENRDA